MSIQNVEQAVFLRPATIEDANLVWSCRQDLSGSFAIKSSAKEETYESHVAWFANAVRDRDRKFFIIERDGASLGYLRFDPAGEMPGYRVSIALLGEARGSGIGSKCLFLGCIQAENAGLSPLYADINVLNEISLRTFHKCGFVTFRADISPDGFQRLVRNPKQLTATACK